jgi:hypothetical protein
MLVLVSDFHEIYKCNGQIHKYGIPGASSRNARVYLQEPSSLQRAHSCEVQEEVGFLTIGSTGELSFLETTFLRDSMPSYL